MSLEVFPVKATKKQGKFDLYDEIKKLVEENDIYLKEGDILSHFEQIHFQFAGKNIEP